MKFDPLKKAGKKRDVQGSLFCTGCLGTGQYNYKGRTTKPIKMTCPLCKGTGKPTFKGKIFLN